MASLGSINSWGVDWSWLPFTALCTDLDHHWGSCERTCRVSITRALDEMVNLVMNFYFFPIDGSGGEWPLLRVLAFSLSPHTLLLPPCAEERLSWSLSGPA